MSQQITFHLQTTTNTTSTASTTTKGGYSPVITPLKDPSDSERKLMAARTVTNENQTAVNPTKLRSKKQKKKMTCAQQAKVIHQLGQPFALSKLPHSIVMQTDSLFLEPCCPKLNAEEKMLLQGLLDQSFLCDNMNLFEVFITDFWIQQEKLIALAHSYDKEKLNDDLAIFLNEHHIVLKLHNLYLFTHGKEKNDLGVCVEQNYNVKFFQTISDIIVLLNSYSKNIASIATKINALQTTRRQGKFKRIIELYEQKFKLLYDHLQLLDKRAKLLTKCFQKEGMATLFVTKKISAWSESCKTKVDDNRQLATLSKFTTFIKAFVIMGNESKTAPPGSVNEKVASYIHIIEEMITSKFSKQTVAKFITAYREYSCFILQRRLSFLRCLKIAQENPSFAHEKAFHGSLEYLPKDMVPLYLHMVLDMEITDKWLNDLHQTMSCHFLAELKEIHVIEPQAYITRLLMMLNLASGSNDLNLEERFADPSLQIIEKKIKELTNASKLQFEAIFKTISFSEIASKLHHKFSAQTFHLSDCLLTLNPIEAILKDGLKLFQLDSLRQEVLQAIRVAKQNHELDDWEPQNLKTEIQEFLFQQCFPLCVYIMILADTEALCTKNRSNDVLHLLPNDVVRLLVLESFDEIFLEEPGIASVEALADPVLAIQEMAVQSTEEVNGKVSFPSKTAAFQKKSQVVVPKSSPMPEKQDFQNALKRQIIVRMLEQMGFVFKRTGRHPIYQHRETSGQVVVPNSVEKPGTRGSIYNQAYLAARKHENKD